MAGLLDMVNDPRQAFLTNLGMGLLSAGGPSARPVSLGQAFGAAMPGALQGAQQAQSYQAQVEEARRKQEAEQRRMQAVGMMPPEAQQAVMAGVPIADVWKQLNPEAKFETYFDPTSGQERKGFIKPGAAPMPVGGAKAASLPEAGQLIAYRDSLPQGSPDRAAVDQIIRKMGTVAPATQITIGEGKGAMEAWKSLGGTIPEKQAIAEQSKNAISRIAQIREALPKAYTGAGATLKDRYAQAASLFGVQVPELAAGQTVDNAVTSLTAAIAKTFGANPSVYETQLLELLSGKRTFEPKAMEVILDNIENDSRGRIRSFNSQIDAFKDPALQAFKVEEPEKQKPKQPVFSRPNQAAINKLRMQPSLRSDFDAEFGPGASAMVLGK